MRNRKKVLEFYIGEGMCTLEYYSPAMLEERLNIPKEEVLQIQRELSDFGFMKQGRIYDTTEIAYRIDPPRWLFEALYGNNKEETQ